MSVSYRIASVVTLGLAACLGSAHAQTNLIVNGSFESPVPTGWQGADPGPIGSPWTNAVALTAWTANDVSLHGWPAASTRAQDGNQVIDLNGSNPGWIEQTVTLVPGHRYQLDWYDSRHYGMASNVTTTYNVLINGAPTGSSVPTGIGTADALPANWWNAQTMQFVASAASTAVRFAATAPGGPVGAFIDNVRLIDITPTVSIACSAASLTDSAGQVSACTVTSSTAAPAGGLSVNLTLPASGSRYTVSCASPVVIAAGATSSTTPCTVTAVANTDVGDGSVTATLTVAAGNGYIPSTTNGTATVTITDDDVVAVPALGGWALLALSGLLGVFGLHRRASH
ncbi:IPTL-CTERM sorting domain-containing protein [Ottowia oryzae]|uniref:IPTL-CTERM protein sorting domain-containing protein n=1 Tax=Ottowia oryzae TaxID=2109914 RepID=A0A2S0MF12_9BURK|nr:IPTL-CTERM sorting domain-containing protein [Ottowia oryzae]AVO34474.1 hypothetical protein C6570_09735 [Ottowia oryzae]